MCLTADELILVFHVCGMPALGKLAFELRSDAVARRSGGDILRRGSRLEGPVVTREQVRRWVLYAREQLRMSTIA